MAIVHLDTGSPSSGEESDRAPALSKEEYIESLRLRSADALERAYAFLSAGEGDDRDEWNRLRADLLLNARPLSDLREAMARIQAPDGSLRPGTLVSGGALGFPTIDLQALTADEQKILGTLEGLLIAGDAKSLHSDWIERSVACLETLQSEDGAFRVGLPEDPGAAAEAEVFWTGMAAGILGRTPYSRPGPLQAAGAFLGKRFSAEAVEHDGYPALLAYSHFYTNVDDDLADEALQWCGRALEKGFRSRRVEAVATLRVLLTCDAQAMPGATFDVAELLERVLEEQAGDGGFAELSTEGTRARMTQTFDGVLAIVRLCAALAE